MLCESRPGERRAAPKAHPPRHRHLKNKRRHGALISAGFGRRFAALIYDGFLLLALLMIFTAASLVFTAGHLAVHPRVVRRGVLCYRGGEAG